MAREYPDISSFSLHKILDRSQLAARVKEFGDYKFFGYLPRDDQYFVHFEQSTGNIIKVYPKKTSDHIPEPSIQITCDQLIDYLEDKNQYYVDLESKSIALVKG